MYDFIIVGGGSAGCVLASHLSENPNNKVLLLEAGPKDNNPMIHMPGGCGEVLKSKTLNWHFYSTPQKHLGGREFFVPRGRTLGGSSSANGMVYIRGHASDYDAMAAAGNEGWAYKDVLPVFKALEDNANGADEFHGSGGPLFVRDAPTENTLYDLFIEAGQQAGHPISQDFNGADQEGVGRFPCTIKNAKRWSSAAAFLKPNLKRPNLEVITDAHVNRVILEGNKATGIEYVRKNKLNVVLANKEIVLAAGAIQSPQILQLSGIGRASDLEKIGVETRVDLPGVGYNLQEHLDLLLSRECIQPNSGSLNGSTRIDKQLKIGLEYIFKKTGIAAGNNIEAGGFIKTNPAQTRPEAQLHFVPAYMVGLIDDLPKQPGVTGHLCLLRPKSKGHVLARTKNPLDKPEIDFNFCAEQEDVDFLVEGFKRLREIMHADCWNGVLGKEILPEGVTLDTDEQIIANLGKITETVYHPVGTCKMGIGDDAVVDPQLRVRGVENLRVADASIIPDLIGGNTNAPAMMIGAKCADFILNH